jgi:alkaline phosphatase D
VAFREDQARNLIATGRIDARSVRIWCRAERGGPLKLRIRGAKGAFDRTVQLVVPGDRDHTACATYPDDFPGEPALEPITAYRCDLRSEAGDLIVGEAAFETAPLGAGDTPDSFSVGIVSCHQPFVDQGTIPDQRLAVLKALPAWFSRHNVKFVMMMGDQVYSDAPGPFSLFKPEHARTVGPSGDIFGWSPEQVRTAFQERYRIFWSPIAWRKLMASWPSHPILDDHEIYDDWGSLPAADEQRRERIVQGGRLAYMDYQGARESAWDGQTLPAAHDYQFRYGTVAGFVFDLRSERSMAQGRVVSEEQLGRFESFLADNAGAEALLLVTSVPFVHIPEWLARKGPQFAPGVDFVDHWSAPHNLADRARIVTLLRRHLEKPQANGQKVVIVGGDVHVGGAFALRLVGTGRPVFQLTSSAVSNPVNDPVDRWLSGLGPALFDTFSRTADNTLEVKLLEPRHGAPGANPFTGMNAGLVQFQKVGGRTNVRLRLLGATGGGVSEVFESALL